MTFAVLARYMIKGNDTEVLQLTGACTEGGSTGSSPPKILVKIILSTKSSVNSVLHYHNYGIVAVIEFNMHYLLRVCAP